MEFSFWEVILYNFFIMNNILQILHIFYKSLNFCIEGWWQKMDLFLNLVIRTFFGQKIYFGITVQSILLHMLNFYLGKIMIILIINSKYFLLRLSTFGHISLYHDHSAWLNCGPNIWSEQRCSYKIVLKVS